MDDLVQMLVDDLVNNVGLELSEAIMTVDFLLNEDFIDYDVLKEIYL